MLCYRDRTFCKFYTTCSMGEDCSRALTEQVAKDAAAFGLPISNFGSEPDCHNEEAE